MSQLQTRSPATNDAAVAGGPIMDHSRRANDTGDADTREDGSGRTVTASVSVDILEDKDAVMLVADLPGVAKEDLSIEVKDGEVVRVRGLRRRDAFFDDDVTYERAFRLPPGVDVGAIVAELKDGVLHLRLPKAEEQKPRTITIQAA